MDLRFDDAVVLVTGASTGIGAAAARHFGRAGATVVVHYNANRERAAEVVRDIEQEGGRAVAVQQDLSEPSGAVALAEHVLQEFGRVDVLVNNAGGLIERRPLGERDADFVRRLLDLNVGQLVALCEAVGPGMAERGRGAIVNVGSVAAVTGGAGGSAVYATTKGAVTTYTRGIARELAPSGVRANTLAPGVIETPFHDRWTTPEQMAGMVSTIPMGRAGSADECAGAILFLAHDGAAGYITGQVLPVNGGQHFLG